MIDMTTIRTTRESAVLLRRLAGRLTAETGRQVSLGDAAGAAIIVASRDLPAVVAALGTEVDG